MLDWTGQTAVVIATGPSLTAEDCAAVREAGVRMLAVNLAFRTAPFADAVFMGDYLAVKQYNDEVPAGMGKWSCVPMAKDLHGWNFIRASNGIGLGPKGMIYNGGNSGFGAINLAYQFGAAKILLLGFDMQKGPTGEKHCHPDHPDRMTQHQPFSEWIPRFEPLARDLKAAGIDVVNVTRRSALACFRTGELTEELKCS